MPPCVRKKEESNYRTGVENIIDETRASGWHQTRRQKRHKKNSVWHRSKAEAEQKNNIQQFNEAFVEG